MRIVIKIFAGPALALLCLMAAVPACQFKEGTNVKDLGGERLAAKASPPEPPRDGAGQESAVQSIVSQF